MTTTTTEDLITIPMSERRPLRVRKDAWPLIASAKDYDAQVEVQANRTWRLRVRQHADGRTAVYGSFYSAFQNERNMQGGFLLTAEEARGDELIRAIRRVAGIIECDERVAQACINDLPCEDLE